MEGKICASEQLCLAAGQSETTSAISVVALNLSCQTCRFSFHLPQAGCQAIQLSELHLHQQCILDYLPRRLDCRHLVTNWAQAGTIIWASFEIHYQMSLPSESDRSATGDLETSIPL
jgi:hypothetical protein